MGIPFTLPMGFLFTATLAFLFTMTLGFQLTISNFEPGAPYRRTDACDHGRGRVLLGHAGPLSLTSSIELEMNAVEGNGRSSGRLRGLTSSRGFHYSLGMIEGVHLIPQAEIRRTSEYGDPGRPSRPSQGEFQ